MAALPVEHWPFLPTLARLVLAMAIGAFVGVERERRGKAGLRTFCFAALLGGIGGLMGESYALLSIAMIGLLVVFLNIRRLRVNQTTELTTSAAMLVVGFAGVLSGQGHTLTPSAIGVTTAALLAWKKPLSGFSLGLSDAELRSAILLGILALVIYPALPVGSVDPWGLVEPRPAWMTVILIAGIGFINYILWRLYGARGLELTSFLGGLINSSAAVSELALRDRETQGHLRELARRGILLATAAMLVRNGALLAILAPAAFASAALALLLMMLATLGFIFLPRSSLAGARISGDSLLHFESPFSLKTALKFGALLLIIQVAGVVAQRAFGQIGVYVTSLFGGLFSSASAVAAAAGLQSRGIIAPDVAGTAAAIAALTSAVVNLPLMFGSGDRHLFKRLLLPVMTIALAGLVGIVIGAIVANH